MGIRVRRGSADFLTVFINSNEKAYKKRNEEEDDDPTQRVRKMMYERIAALVASCSGLSARQEVMTS